MKLLFVPLIVFFHTIILPAEEVPVIRYRLCPGLQPAQINVAQVGYDACREKRPLSLIVAVVVNGNNGNIFYNGRPLLHYTRDKRCTEYLLQQHADIYALEEFTIPSQRRNPLEHHLETFFLAHFENETPSTQTTIQEACEVIQTLVPHYPEVFRENLEKKWQQILRRYEKNNVHPQSYSMLPLSLELTSLLLPISETTLELVD